MPENKEQVRELIGIRQLVVACTITGVIVMCSIAGPSLASSRPAHVSGPGAHIASCASALWAIAGKLSSIEKAQWRLVYAAEHPKKTETTP